MTEGASNQRTGHPADRGGRPAGGRRPSRSAPARPSDRPRQVRARERRRVVDGRGGAPRPARAAEPASVRTTSGGNASPLSGQQACSPDIPGEPAIAASTGQRPLPARSPPTSTATARDDLLWYGPGGAGDYRWAGHSRPALPSRSMSVSGDYIPVAGDFDGDGCGDVLWYGAGHAPRLRVGGGARSRRSVAVAVERPRLRASERRLRRRRPRRRALVPARRPAPTPSGTGAPPTAPSTREPVTVNGTYEPVVGDLDGDSADDIFWYARGSGGESRVARPGRRPHVQPRGGQERRRGRTGPSPSTATGTAPTRSRGTRQGVRPTHRWSGTAVRRSRSRARPSTATTCPSAGDFDGDGRDDIAWYGPGGRPESMWWGDADGGVTADACGTPPS